MQYSLSILRTTTTSSSSVATRCSPSPHPFHRSYSVRSSKVQQQQKKNDSNRWTPNYSSLLFSKYFSPTTQLYSIQPALTRYPFRLRPYCFPSLNSTRSFFSSSKQLQQQEEENVHYKPTHFKNAEGNELSSSQNYGPKQRYKDIVSKKLIHHDPKQYYAVELLDEVYQKVKNYEPKPKSSTTSSSSSSSKEQTGGGGGMIASLFGGFGKSKNNNESTSNKSSTERTARAKDMQGKSRLYIQSSLLQSR